jgi:hypothetical protein
MMNYTSLQGGGQPTGAPVQTQPTNQADVNRSKNIPFFVTFDADKVKQQKERINSKKEQHIDAMSNEDVVNELKEKKLPTFGTAQERKDRLKKHLGKLRNGE